VIVLSIPDYGVTPFAKNMNPEKIAAEINAFNAINLVETGNATAHYVEITRISRMAATDKALLAADNLHPSAAMYSKWVEKLLPLATPIVNKSKQ
jgi:lysophospholipase L1-like esterase